MTRWKIGIVAILSPGTIVEVQTTTWAGTANTEARIENKRARIGNKRARI